MVKSSHFKCNYQGKQSENKLLSIKIFVEETHFFLASSKFAPDLIRKVQKK